MSLLNFAFDIIFWNTCFTNVILVFRWLVGSGATMSRCYFHHRRDLRRILKEVFLRASWDLPIRSTFEERNTTYSIREFLVSLNHPETDFQQQGVLNFKPALSAIFVTQMWNCLQIVTSNDSKWSPSVSLLDDRMRNIRHSCKLDALPSYDDFLDTYQ